MCGGKSCACWILLSLVDVAPRRSDARPPFPPSRDVHDGRYDHHSDQRGIEQHGHREPESDKLYIEHAREPGIREAADYDSPREAHLRRLRRMPVQAAVMVPPRLLDRYLH